MKMMMFSRYIITGTNNYRTNKYMNTILFDLDGTLLPMDTRGFTDTFYKAVTGRFSRLGVVPENLIHAIVQGTDAMIANDGFLTNEECFWNTFSRAISDDGNPISKGDLKLFKHEFENFYKKDFFVTRLNTTATPIAKECVRMLKNKGYRLVVAANPVFPEEAMIERIRWADLDENDFDLITSMENSCFSKPNLNYYRKVLQMVGVTADECMMVGNDVTEDMCALKLGIDVFLLDECLINKQNIDVTDFKMGDWRTFRELVSELPEIR